MKLFIIPSILFFFGNAKGQVADTAMCSKSPVLNIYSTVNYYPYLDMVHIRKDSLAKGFKIIVNDASLNVTGFTVYFYAKWGDLYSADVKGSQATKENLPILKHLHADEWMAIECISVTKNKQKFKTRSFKIWIDEN